jgi:hypothetical protein
MEPEKNTMDEFSQTFEQEIPTLHAFLMQNLKSFQSQVGFRSVWEDFEGRIIDDTQKFLNNIFPELKPHNLTKAKSKSVFPDLEVAYKGNIYAIDVKSGEDVKDPWYDMGRLDTFEKRHLNKYKNEYFITVKWHRAKKGITVVNLFVEPFYKSVGLHPSSGGVLYRPYDGKLRPKSWKYFESGKAHWNNINEFREGLEKSKKFRRVEIIADWYKQMSPSEKSTFRKLIHKIDDQMELF